MVRRPQWFILLSKLTKFIDVVDNFLPHGFRDVLASITYLSCLSLNTIENWEPNTKIRRVMRNFELELWELANEFEWWDLSVEIWMTFKLSVELASSIQFLKEYFRSISILPKSNMIWIQLVHTCIQFAYENLIIKF